MSQSEQKILAGRRLVEAYRTAHTKLYERAWHKGIPEEHTPILHILQDGLTGLGYKSLNDFFTQSRALEDGWE